MSSPIEQAAEIIHRRMTAADRGRERSIEFGRIDPTYLVSANSRIHWAKRARVTRYWRHRTYIQAWGANIPSFGRARVTITARFPDRRRRDVANLYPYVGKPIVDGLVDAGVLADDNDAFLVGPDLRRAPERGPLAITVTIQEIS